MLVINLWGAPSAGKSTTAAGLFFLLKINKWRVELVGEFAKEMVWEKNAMMLDDQAFLFSEQNRRLRRIQHHDVEAVITDSPLPLSAFYQPKGYLETFTPLVMEQFHRYNNINYMLKKTMSFEAIGRRHNEKESQQLDKDLRAFIQKHEIEMIEMEANPQTPQAIFEDLMRRRQPLVNMPLV